MLKVFKHLDSPWGPIGLLIVGFAAAGMVSIMMPWEPPAQARAKPPKLQENRWYPQVMTDGPVLWIACVKGDMYTITREGTWESRPLDTPAKGLAIFPRHPRCPTEA